MAKKSNKVSKCVHSEIDHDRGMRSCNTGLVHVSVFTPPPPPSLPPKQGEKLLLTPDFHFLTSFFPHLIRFSILLCCSLDPHSPLRNVLLSVYRAHIEATKAVRSTSIDSTRNTNRLVFHDTECCYWDQVSLNNMQLNSSPIPGIVWIEYP